MAEEPPSGKPILPAPSDRVNVHRDGTSLVIDIRWFGLQHILQLVIVIALIGSAEQSEFAALVVLLLAYPMLAGFLNHTIIRVGDGVLDMRIKPLPWWSSAIRLEATSIQEVFHDLSPFSFGSGRWPGRWNHRWNYEVIAK